MRSQLVLVPLAAVATIATPAQAEIYLTVQQAQRLLFPNATFTRDFVPLTDDQYDTIRDAARPLMWLRELKAWRVSTGGWFIVDQVKGRDDIITYALGLNAQGAVTGIEIIECEGGWGQVRWPAWRHQFVGLRRGQIGEDRITVISGTSLSSWHIMAGVHRMLVAYDLALRQRR